MEIFGVCLLVTAILFLIDKNQQWQRFWRVVRIALAAVIAGTALTAGGVYLYQRHQNEKLAAKWKDAPDFIPAVAEGKPWEKYARRGDESRRVIRAGGKLYIVPADATDEEINQIVAPAHDEFEQYKRPQQKK